MGKKKNKRRKSRPSSVMTLTSTDEIGMRFYIIGICFGFPSTSPKEYGSVSVKRQWFRKQTPTSKSKRGTCIKTLECSVFFDIKLQLSCIMYLINSLKGISAFIIWTSALILEIQNFASINDASIKLSSLFISDQSIMYSVCTKWKSAFIFD